MQTLGREADLQGSEGLWVQLLKGADGEEVVVGARQVGGRHQHQPADVARAGNVFHPALTPAMCLIGVCLWCPIWALEPITSGAQNRQANRLAVEELWLTIFCQSHSHSRDMQSQQGAGVLVHGSL